MSVQLSPHALKAQPKLQAAFAAYLCERMLPNYQYFYEHTQWGNPNALRGALDLCWEKIAQNKNANWARWSETLSEITPEATQFDFLGVYAANAACTALQCLIQGFAEKNTQAFIDVAELSKSSVAHYLELGIFADLASVKEREQAIKAHELWLYEQDVQSAMLEYLSTQNEKNMPEVTRELRQIAREEGYSNLGV